MNVPSIEDLVRSARVDMIKLQDEINYIKSTDVDILFTLPIYNNYLRHYNWVESVKDEHLLFVKQSLLFNKKNELHKLNVLLANHIGEIRDQKLNDIGI